MWRPVVFFSTSACRAQLKCESKMEKSEDQTDEDETEWESSFADPVPFEAAAAAAGS